MGWPRRSGAFLQWSWDSRAVDQGGQVCYLSVRRAVGILLARNDVGADTTAGRTPVNPYQGAATLCTSLTKQSLLTPIGRPPYTDFCSKHTDRLRSGLVRLQRSSESRVSCESALAQRPNGPGSLHPNPARGRRRGRAGRRYQSPGHLCADTHVPITRSRWRRRKRRSRVAPRKAPSLDGRGFLRQEDCSCCRQKKQAPPHRDQR